MGKSAAFTGPRPEKLPFDWGDHAARSRLGEKLGHCIDLLANRGYTRFFSGMSRGVDLLAADAVLRRKAAGRDMALWAAVPHPGQTEGWPAADRAEHARILARCDRQVLVSDRISPWSFSLRNRYMVEQAEFLVAVYDGKSGGGTAETLGFATQKGLPLLLIDPVSFGVTELSK